MEGVTKPRLHPKRLAANVEQDLFDVITGEPVEPEIVRRAARHDRVVMAE